VSGANRTYNLRVPDNYDNNNPYPLMLAYHWLSGTANDVSEGSQATANKPYYGLWELAEESMIFVAPEGTNGAMGNGWYNSGGSDVEFSRQLLSLLESEFCIDQSRVFCQGFSMGGSMSYAMASAAPELIRAVAIHTGGV
jgi:poly(3-hydroxybutyrate) depolymerase